MEHRYHETLCEIVLPTQIMAEKPEFRFFYSELDRFHKKAAGLMKRLLKVRKEIEHHEQRLQSERTEADEQLQIAE